MSEPSISSEEQSQGVDAGNQESSPSPAPSQE